MFIVEFILEGFNLIVDAASEEAVIEILKKAGIDLSQEQIEIIPLPYA